MYLITVIPIVATAHTDVLDYFAKDAIKPGMMVTVPLRKKKMYGLVIQSRPLREAKHMVKASDFAMRKIDSVIGLSALSSKTIAGFHATAQYLATPIGAIINQSTPKDYLSEKLTEPNTTHTQTPVSTNPTLPSILQLPFHERISWYAAHTEQEKILIIVPTDEQAQSIARQLDNQRTLFVLSGKINNKKRTAISQSHIVIGTPNAIGMIDSIAPDMLVIEHESDNRYIRRKRPFIDMRIVAECVAAAHDILCVFADTLVRVYTHARTHTKELTYLLPPVWPEFPTVQILPYVSENPSPTQTPAISPFLNNELIAAISNHAGRMFMYVPRKGLAPSVVCQDCGTIVTCKECDLPMKLVKKTAADGVSNHYYSCIHPQHTIPAYNTCRTCGGHRLVGLGITTLRIKEELHQLFPKLPTAVLDQDEVPVRREQQHIIDTYIQRPRSVLIGTSLAVPHITNATTLVVIPSFDMLLSQPSADAQESALRTVAAITQQTDAPIIVQTRLSHHPLFTALQHNSIAEWYSNEITLRKRYQSAPFTTPLVIHAILPRTQIDSFKQQIALLNLAVEAIAITSGKNKREIHATATIRLSKDDWNLSHQNEHLHALLRGLPPQYWTQLTSAA